MDLVVVANARAIADADKGEDDTVITNHHIVLDIHEGEYLTVIANLCLWANLSFWGYFVHFIHNLKIIQFENVKITSRHRGPDRDSLQPASLKADR